MGGHRDLHYPLRRQRQVGIRDSSEDVGISDGLGVGATEGCEEGTADGWVVGMMYVQ